MAWPHCCRILGRRLGSAACDHVSASTRDFGGIWKLSSPSAAAYSHATRSSNVPIDNHSNSNSSNSSGTSTRKFTHAGPETINSGHSWNYGLRQTSSVGGFWHNAPSQQALHHDLSRNRHLHSSSIESKSSASAARAAEATTAMEHVETMHGAKAPRAESGVELTDDGEILYSDMTSQELLVTLSNLQLLSYEPLVELSLKVLNSRLLRWPVTSTPLLWLIKRTTYSHFCAGENTVEAGQTLSRMWELGLRGVLDYSLEDAEDEEFCDDNCAGFLKTVASSRELPPGSVSFICVKISAICPISLLERVSDHLRWQLKNPEYKLPWKQEGLPVLAPESPTYQTQSAPEPLSAEEEATFLRAQQRLRLICEGCEKENIPILLDAEYTNIQPGIDYMTYVAVFEFNTGGRPIVYVTMQAYMKDTPSRLSMAMAEASRRNAFLALKLVRGAYIVRESALAKSLGFPSPIHNSPQDTHNCYNECASRMLHRVTSGNSSIVLATHNTSSGRILSQRAYELGLEKADPRVHFAQLKGMADSLSLALVHAGFNVSKYVPFGPVIHVVPYLVRRAHENRGVLCNTSMDRQRMRKELGRRLRSAVRMA
ncbi:unnamed protein product [Calypogeia fissa]